MSKLTARTRDEIPSKEFANPKKRRFPLEDKAHIANAESRERFATPAEKKKIDAAADKAFGKKSAAEKLYPNQGKK